MTYALILHSARFLINNPIDPCRELVGAEVLHRWRPSLRAFSSWLSRRLNATQVLVPPYHPRPSEVRPSNSTLTANASFSSNPVAPRGSATHRAPAQQARPLIVTFVLRRHFRKILNLESIVDRFQSRHNISFHTLVLEELSVSEQASPSYHVGFCSPAG